MILKLPSVLYTEIGRYLTFTDIINLQNTSSISPKIYFKCFTYSSDTIYKSLSGSKIVQKSYLLTNNKKKEKPTQIRDNYVEIKLYHERMLYYYIIYQDIYRPEKDIMYYLKNVDKKRMSRKIYYNNKSYQLSFCLK